MNRKKLPDQLKEKYKLVILSAETFEEKASFSGRLWYLITGALSLTIIIFMLIILLIRITPLREYLVGADDSFGRGELVNAYQRIDSLEQRSAANVIFLKNLQEVISGKAGETGKEVQERDKLALEQEGASTGTAAPPGDEEALKALIEMGTPYEAAPSDTYPRRGIATYTFFSPVNGVLSAGFDLESEHDAIDIAVKQDEPVKATLDGHVLFASYTPETGYVIIMQHADNLVSVYKHCAALLKKVGSFVRKGEVLALAGNTGELTTGPHLHFELWYNGAAINPRDYIMF